MELFTESLLAEAEAFIGILPRIIAALIIAIIIYLIGKLAASGVFRILQRSRMQETYHTFFRKLVKGVAFFLALVVFLNLVGYNTLAASLVAGGGLTAVILGFAFKDIGENFLAGFILAFSRPFNTKDVIETGGITGIVQSIQLRHTHVRTSDGCDVFIPSAQLITKPLLNYTLDGLRRGNFTVGIDYADDAKKALEILLETTQFTKGVLKKPKVLVQIRGFNTDYVELQVFFWINAKDQELNLGRVKTDAMNRCRLRLIEENFTFSSDVTSAISVHPLDVKIRDEKEMRKEE